MGSGLTCLLTGGLSLFTGAPSTLAAPGGDVLTALDVRQVKVGGEIGRRIDLTVNNNLLVLDAEMDFLPFFRAKNVHEHYVGLGKLIDSAVRLASDATIDLKSGVSLKIRQETDYPTSGHVVIHLDPSRPTRLTLKLRIPRWCSQTAVTIDGKPWETPIASGTFLAIDREWMAGDLSQAVACIVSIRTFCSMSRRWWSSASA